MRILDWRELDPKAKSAALARPARRRDAIVVERVRRILSDVADEGEAAVRRWAETIDGRAPVRLDLGRARIEAARAALAREDLAALELAIDNVRRYHEATRPTDLTVEVTPGLVCRRSWRPIASCGLYVPAGTAPLFSTLIMLAEPARIAGAPLRVATTPPGATGAPHPMMIAAAAACGLEALYIIGGAQAIAALTFGAVTPKVLKLFGPGNAYVAEAKRQAAALPGGPQIDAPAGPSELMAIASREADPARLADDLLSQAEHDADAQVILLTDSPGLAAETVAELDRRCASLPRAAIARAALAEGRAIVVSALEQACDIAEAYAPEHLALHVTEDAARLAERISTAGTIFLGPASAETFGDYLNGPSHVLPTDGAGRSWSGVAVESFMRSFVVQSLTEEAAHRLAPSAARLARLEGLEAHARAAEARIR